MQKQLFKFLILTSGLFWFLFSHAQTHNTESLFHKNSSKLIATNQQNKNFVLARNNYNSPSPILEKHYKADEVPHPLQNIKVEEHIGDFLDLSLEFVNSKGQTQTLQTYFNELPVVMTVVYYNCPSLCNFHLNGLFTGLNNLQNFHSYQFVVVSMDASETPSLAQEKKLTYLKEFPNLPANQVHFLTGSSSAIQSLTQALGFNFRWDEETEQFAHSPVAYTLSPKGLISRYLYGVEFVSQTLRLGLLEAAKGKVGNMIDRVLLFCYRFNSEANKYTLYAVNIMKAGGILMILFLIALLAPTWIKQRKHHS